MVKAFQNYGFARDGWTFLVVPAWYPGLVRVGSLSIPTSIPQLRSQSQSRRPQLMSAPVRPGSFVYAREVSCFTVGLLWRGWV